MSTEAEPPGVRRRILLLGAQAFALGVTLAWVTIPANTIFLETFGPGLLPVTYIGAAVAGAVASVALARALRTTALSRVVARVLAATSVVLVLSWVVVALVGADWLTFGLVVALPIALPIGFMFVVGQAGMLLDVRVLKALYPRVIAGFALGFTVGGLAGPLLIGLLGGTEQLLAASAVTAAVFLALVGMTIRTFPAELGALEEDDLDDAGADRVTLRTLLGDRFVALIMAFQMLSAVETQWLDFLVYDRASQRYPNGDDLATFVGRFSAIAYGADIVFLLLIAGLLLRRFGLRLGLSANPVVVLAMVGSVLVATVAQGSGATLVFVLVVATRVSDMVLSDGTTRTSVSAAYQAVPTRLRLAAQANTESLAVPVAIGFAGVVLLVVRATVGTDGPVLAVLAGVVLATWIGCAAVIYRSYRENLLANLRHRLLEPGELAAEDLGTEPVVDRLLASDDARDVRLGLAALSEIEPERSADRLVALATAGREDVHGHVVDRLAELHPDRAIALARDGLGHPQPVVRAAALTTVAALGSRDDVRAASELLHDPDLRVREAAARAISALGDDDEQAALARALDEAATSSRPEERMAAGRMLAACEPGSPQDPDRLARLLADDDAAVVSAALDAVRWPRDEDLTGAVVDLLRRHPTDVAAAEALGRSGASGLELLDRLLDEPAGPRPTAHLLAIRSCRSIGGAEAAAVLRRHVEHPSRDVGLAALEALATVGADAADETGSSDAAEWTAAVVADDLDHAARLLQAQVILGDAPIGRPVLDALADELVLVRRRVLAALAVRYGAEGIDRVAFQLAQPDTRIHALALEWLDVTLVGPDRRALALLDPVLTVDDRARALARSMVLALVSTEELLVDLVDDPQGRWRRPWLSACAVLAAVEVGLPVAELAVAQRDRPDDVEGIVAETVRAMAVSGAGSGG